MICASIRGRRVENPKIKRMDIARPYQIELFEEALERNMIAYLDTGAGKTLISALLAQYYAKDMPAKPIPEEVLVEHRRKEEELVDLLQALESEKAPGPSHEIFNHKLLENQSTVTAIQIQRENGSNLRRRNDLVKKVRRLENSLKKAWPKQNKKIVFLVPTVPLVEQQARVITQYCDVSVGQFSSDSNQPGTRAQSSNAWNSHHSDPTKNHNTTVFGTINSKRATWDYFEWQFEISKYQLLVMTPQIFLNVLRHGLMQLEKSVYLIVFDECHHAVKNHPYNRIMQEFYHKLKLEERPKVFGMTASPILSKVTNKAMSTEKLMELQANLDSIIVTVRDRGSLEGYVSSAQEVMVEYDHDGPELEETTKETGPAALMRGLRPQIIDSKISPALIYYLSYVSHLILMHNAANDLSTANKFQRMITIVKDIKDELGIWCAGHIAEAYYRSVIVGIKNSNKRGFLKRKMRDDLGKKSEAPEHSTSENFVASTVSFKDFKLPQLKVFTPGNLPSVSVNRSQDSFGSLDINSDSGTNSSVPFHPKPCVEDAKISDFSSKLKALIDIISRFLKLEDSPSDSGNQKGFRALIFVSRRATAKVISDLLNEFSLSLFQNRLRCGFVTGHGGSLSASASKGADMSSKAQKHVVDLFRSGKLNVLVVTSVAEEGIDVPACNLVVIFDNFQSATSYVQSRGRARHSNSHYVIMSKRNDKSNLKMVAESKIIEHMVQKTCSTLASQGSIRIKDISIPIDSNDDAVDTLLGRIDEDEELQVEGTGARVSLINSVEVLKKYCTTLSRDKYTSISSNQAKFVELSDGSSLISDIWKHAYAVKLPSSSPLSASMIMGSFRCTRKLAIQSAALKACRMLYHAGCLNQHLLSNVPKTSSTESTWSKRDNKRAKLEFSDSKEDTLESSGVTSFSRLVPSCLSWNQSWEKIMKDYLNNIGIRQAYSWTMSPTTSLKSIHEFVNQITSIKFQSADSVSIYLSAVEIRNMSGELYTEKSVAILTLTKLPNIEEFLIFPEKDQPPLRIKIVGLKRYDKYNLTRNQWILARDFHLKLFSMILKAGNLGAGDSPERDPRKIGVSRTYSWDFDEELEEKVYCRMYKLLPIMHLGDDWEINWDFAEGIAAYDPSKNNVESYIRNFCKDKSSKFEKLSPENLCSLNESLNESLLLVPHNYSRYSALSLSKNLSLKSSFPSNASKPDGTDFLTYFKEKHGIELKAVDLPLLEVKHVNKPENLLNAKVPRGISKLKHTIHIPPELCYIAPLDVKYFNFTLLLPSILYKMELIYIIYDFILNFNTPFSDYRLLYSAFCTPNANDIVNYERLETLGDSFLKYCASCHLYRKYPHLDEGSLSSLRSGKVNNKRLAKIAVRNGLPRYMFASPFYPKLWAPPELFIETKNNPDAQSKQIEEQQISLKMMADFVEALLGAYVVGHSRDSGKNLLNLLGILEEIDMSDIYKLERNKKIESLEGEYSTSTMKPFGNTLDRQSSDKKFEKFKKLENLLGYTFKNKSILYEAFTHASYEKATTQSYQRLEYLGDAALDWIITEYLYENYPNAASSDLTDMRQSVVNNSSFGRMSAQLGLNLLLFYNSNYLEADMVEFMNWFSNADNKNLGPNEMNFECPKFLGDIFESLCGAILVDSDYDIDKLWDIMGELVLKPFIDYHCHPDRMRRNPAREFYEVAQNLGHSTDEIEVKCSDINERDAYRQIHSRPHEGSSTKYLCEIYLSNTLLCRGEGNTVTIAKRMACINGIDLLKKQKE